MNTLTLRSFAKLNLYLRVTGRQSDSYHTLSTLFERIGLFDTIRLRLRRDGKIRLTGALADVPRDPSNLAWRAAELFRKHTGLAAGADIVLRKRIPVGAGLGGGSSNAATVLLGLNRLSGAGLSTAQLAGLARSLGADVAFFVYESRFALASGRGDRIRPLPQFERVRLWHVLVVPHLSVSTREIFHAWDRISLQKAALTSPRENDKLSILAVKMALRQELKGFLFNSLEKVTFGLYPQLASVRAALLRCGVESVLMSGSGSAVFGVVSSRREALSVRRQLERQRQRWRIFVVPGA